MNTVSVPQEKLSWVLFGIRASVFLVLIMWTLDKLINPGHTAAVFKTFYAISDIGPSLILAMGIVQAAIVISFLIGFQKRWMTLIILVLHLGSTLAPMARYFDPFANLLFFAAWPILAAIVGLYVLRDFDTKFSIDKPAQ
ncbi:hypothetical protein O1D97_18635 [Marinomonas sp. 15G1-11]|uniref:DoxX protein n=1 Tax=Marinomonas phaeophyticola TaxID=3004091 RepID=A0ABT4JZB8_9GAMM|nr:hypothetical protein [Marinomonas sp. 15G1-11]MCZ2723571.1 hypothetical protein [Marinomonas sp. 15G1-11]